MLSLQLKRTFFYTAEQMNDKVGKIPCNMFHLEEPYQTNNIFHPYL